MKRRRTIDPESSLQLLRECNNAYKRKLISDANLEGKDVFDCGFGPGGDIQKYTHSGVRICVGVDINEEHIREAKQRLAHLRPTTQFYLLCPVHFERPEETAKALQSLPESVPRTFHAGAAFFSIHTIFESASTLAGFCQTIHNHLSLQSASRFMCTFM